MAETTPKDQEKTIRKKNRLIIRPDDLGGPKHRIYAVAPAAPNIYFHSQSDQAINNPFTNILGTENIFNSYILNEKAKFDTAFYFLSVMDYLILYKMFNPSKFTTTQPYSVPTPDEFKSINHYERFQKAIIGREKLNIQSGSQVIFIGINGIVYTSGDIYKNIQYVYNFNSFSVEQLISEVNQKLSYNKGSFAEFATLILDLPASRTKIRTDVYQTYAINVDQNSVKRLQSNFSEQIRSFMAFQSAARLNVKNAGQYLDQYLIKKPNESPVQKSAPSASPTLPTPSSTSPAAPPPTAPVEDEQARLKREEKIVIANKTRINEQAALIMNADQFLVRKYNIVDKDAGLLSEKSRIEEHYDNFVL